MSEGGDYKYTYTFGDLTLTACFDVTKGSWTKTSLKWLKVNGEGATNLTFKNRNADGLEEEITFKWKGTTYYLVWVSVLGEWMFSTQRTMEPGNKNKPSIGEKSIGPIFIRNKHSGLVMDCKYFDNADSTPVIQYGRKKSSYDNQLFTAEKVGGTFEKPIYKIVCHFSGKVLDICGASTENGAPLIEYHYHNGDNQQFYIEAQGEHVVFVNVRSGKALTVPGSSDAPETQIVQEDRTNADNQLWEIVYPGGRGLTVCVQDCATKVEYIVPPNLKDNTVYRESVTFTNKLPIPIRDCKVIIDVDENSPFHSESMSTGGVSMDLDVVSFDFGHIPAGESKTKYWTFSFPKLDKDMPDKKFQGIFQLAPFYRIDYAKWGGTSHKLPVAGN